MEKHVIRDILYEVEQQRKRLLQPYFLDIGLTLGQGQPRILYKLLRNGPMTQRELSDACRLDATTMSRTLDRLEENGLLRRRREDRRANTVGLTEKGRGKAEQVRRGFEFVDELLWRELSEHEAQTLLSIMQKLQRNLSEGFDDPLAARLKTP